MRREEEHAEPTRLREENERLKRIYQPGQHIQAIKRAQAAEAKLAEAQEQLRVSVSGGRLVLEDLATTRGALGEAAMSMETIADGAGSGLLLEMSQVRGYARSRAAVARAALRGDRPWLGLDPLKGAIAVLRGEGEKS